MVISPAGWFPWYGREAMGQSIHRTRPAGSRSTNLCDLYVRLYPLLGPVLMGLHLQHLQGRIQKFVKGGGGGVRVLELTDP